MGAQNDGCCLASSGVTTVCGMNYLCFADSSKHFTFCRSLGRYRFMMVIMVCNARVIYTRTCFGFVVMGNRM